MGCEARLMEQGGETPSHLPRATHPHPKQQSVHAQGSVKDVNNDNKICFPEISVGLLEHWAVGFFQGSFCCPAQGMRPRSSSPHRPLLGDAKVAPRKWFEMCRQEKGAGESWERGGSVLLIECHLLAPHPCHRLPREGAGEGRGRWVPSLRGW